jgi:Flp pilus assembly protein TadD
MTFKENSIDYSATMNANRSLFLEKWKDIIYSQKADEYHVRIEKNRQVEHLVRWGETAFCKGDILRAFKIFERALRIDPHNTEALNNLGVIQWELGDREAAVETFQTVLCIKPGDPDALSNLSDAVSAGAKEVDAPTRNKKTS